MAEVAASGNSLDPANGSLRPLQCGNSSGSRPAMSCSPFLLSLLPPSEPHAWTITRLLYCGPATVCNSVVMRLLHGLFPGLARKKKRGNKAHTHLILTSPNLAWPTMTCKLPLHTNFFASGSWFDRRCRIVRKSAGQVVWMYGGWEPSGPGSCESETSPRETCPGLLHTNRRAGQNDTCVPTRLRVVCWPVLFG